MQPSLSTGGKSVVDGVDRGNMDSMGKNRGLVDNWLGNSVEVLDGLDGVDDFSNIVSGGQMQLPEVSGLSEKKDSDVYKIQIKLLLDPLLHDP